MRDFFHGWRRKMGVVTLMMACVFAAGWVRSFWLSECVWGFMGWFCVSHEAGTIHVTVYRFADPFSPWGWQSTPYVYEEVLSPSGVIHSMRLWWSIAFPYYEAVIPLILLSAYLLLSKPCKKPPAEST